jgi:DNA-binding NarL/FixJ family response regulator
LTSNEDARSRYPFVACSSILVLRTVKTVKVYIVDDSASVTKVLKALVSDVERAEVVGCARTVAQARIGIRDTQPDLAIIDIHLKEESGLEVLKDLRDAGQSIPVVIMLSGETDQRYRQRCLDLRADYVMDKALEFHLIAWVIRSITARR